MTNLRKSSLYSFLFLSHFLTPLKGIRYFTSIEMGHTTAELPHATLYNIELEFPANWSDKHHVH